MTILDYNLSYNGQFLTIVQRKQGIDALINSGVLKGDWDCIAALLFHCTILDSKKVEHLSSLV